MGRLGKCGVNRDKNIGPTSFILTSRALIYLVDASKEEMSERLGAVPTVLEPESWTPEDEDPDESPEADDTLHRPAEEDAVDTVSKAFVD